MTPKTDSQSMPDADRTARVPMPLEEAERKFEGTDFASDLRQDPRDRPRPERLTARIARLLQEGTLKGA